METKRYYVDCQNWKCFKEGSFKKCHKCDKGKITMLCPHCSKEHIAQNIFLRIGCSCGGEFLPIYDTCEFVNKELVIETISNAKVSK